MVTLIINLIYPSRWLFVLLQTLGSDAFIWILLATALLAWAWAARHGSQSAWRDWMDIAMAWIALQLGVGTTGMCMVLNEALTGVYGPPGDARTEHLLAGYKLASCPVIFSVILAGIFVLILVVTQLSFRPGATPRTKVARRVLMLGGVVMAFGILLYVGWIVGVSMLIQDTSDLRSVYLSFYSSSEIPLATTQAAALYLLIRPRLFSALDRPLPPEVLPAP